MTHRCEDNSKNSRQFRKIGGPVLPAFLSFLLIGLVFSTMLTVSCKKKEMVPPTPTPTPLPPKPNGRLVFMQTGHLFLIDPNGTHLKQITHGSNDWYPAVSPDGKKLAFWSNADGHYNLWVIGSNGSGLKQLTMEQDEFFDKNARRFLLGNRPCWTADSQALIFAAKDKIWRVDADGYNLSTIASMPNCLSPAIDKKNKKAIEDKEDIKFVVYVSDYEAQSPGVFNLWKFDIASEAYMQLTDFHVRSAGSPVIPNNKEIIFTLFKGNHSNIVSIPIDSDMENLTIKDLTQDGRSLAPYPNPDGTKLVFSSQDAKGNYNLYTMPANDDKKVKEKVNGAIGAFPAWSSVMSPSDIAALDAYNKKYKSGKKPPQPEKTATPTPKKVASKKAPLATTPAPSPAKAKPVAPKKTKDFIMPTGPFEVAPELTRIIQPDKTEGYFGTEAESESTAEEASPVKEEGFVKPK